MKRYIYGGLMAACLLLNQSLFAYDFLPGDWFVLPQVRATINGVRYTEESNGKTPAAGFMFGADLDYMFDENIAIYGSFLPYVATDTIDFGFGAGVRYRNIEWLNPVIFYATGGLMFSLMVPFDDGKLHTNFGLRMGAGLEYFVLRNLALDFSIDFVPSVLLVGGRTHFELAINPGIGVLIRI